MLRHVLCAGLVALGPAIPAGAGDDSPSREDITKHLRTMRSTQWRMMNIAPTEGEYLARLVQQLDAKRVLEVGTSNGYSAIWLALGLRETGGRLVTLEIDEKRHGLAVENFRATGMDSLIDARLADALQEIPKLDGPFDLVFLDAWKGDYLRYLEMVLPKIRRGGAIAAHNVVSHASELAEFLDTVREHPGLVTEIVTVGPAGLSISMKK